MSHVENSTPRREKPYPTPLITAGVRKSQRGLLSIEQITVQRKPKPKPPSVMCQKRDGSDELRG